MACAELYGFPETGEGGRNSSRFDTSAHHTPNCHVIHSCVPGHTGWPVGPVLAYTAVFLRCISEHRLWSGRRLIQTLCVRESSGYQNLGLRESPSCPNTQGSACRAPHWYLDLALTLGAIGLRTPSTASLNLHNFRPPLFY